MKSTRILFYLITVIFSFVSCTNDNSEITQNDQSVNFMRMSSFEIKETYNQIISFDDTTDQLVALSMLSPEDKYSIWMLKLENFISSNTLTIAQIDFVKGLKSDLNEKIFDEKTVEHEIFIDTKRDFYMQRAQQLFGENEGWYLLTRVENINHRIDRINNNNSTYVSTSERAISACNCEGDAEGFSDCKRLTGISLEGFSWEYGTCSGMCYVRIYLGFWESDNNGRCTFRS